jgi:hypothetical protein
VAGSLIVLCRVGRVSESEARAVLIAGEGRRSQVERVWDRMATGYLKPKP